MHDGQRRAPRQRHEIEFQFREHAQRALGSAEQFRQVELLVLRPVEVDAAIDEAVQVVAAAAAPVARRAGTYRICILAGELVNLAIDATLQATARLMLSQGLIAQRTYASARAVGQNNLGLQHVIGRHAVEYRMAAGGIVGDDAAHRGTVAAGRVRAELQAMGLERQV